VDGRVVTRHDYLLKTGQTVTIAPPGTRGQKKRSCCRTVRRRGAARGQQAGGLLTVTSEDGDDETAYLFATAHVRLAGPKNRVFIVHRLYRDTSGIVLFAKNEALKLALQEDWNGLVSHRGYTAVAEGRLRDKSGTVRSWLKETTTHLVYSSHTPGDGLEAVTAYTVLRESAAYSLLDIRLETGRKNQIRVHMKDLGNPVAGDRKYGARTETRCTRLCLHAHRLELTHPLTGAPLRFETDIPGTFSNLFSEK
jgi:23S rRNA pseudouridine1911/1915/1917 synthase